MTIQHAEAFSMGIIHTIGAFVVYDEHFSNIYSKYSDGTGASAQRSDWAVKLESKRRYLGARGRAFCAMALASFNSNVL